MKKVITFTSDFGDDFARAQVELVVYSVNPEAKFIVTSNQVTPFSLTEGSFILSNVYHLAPVGSIHIVVIDPGVGSNRRGVAIKTKNYWFVGPDNGVLYPTASKDGIEKVFVIDITKLGNVATTFHGRDVFSKVAAYLSLNKDPKLFSNEVNNDSLVKLEENSEDKVVHVDPYGNIKLSTSASGFMFGDKIKLKLKDKVFDIPFCKTFTDVKKGELLIYRGSHNTLEIAKNLGSAVEVLETKINDAVYIQK